MINPSQSTEYNYWGGWKYFRVEIVAETCIK